MPDNLHGGCWWYERRMPDNLHYIHGGWLVVRASHACSTIYATNTAVVGGTSIACPTIYTTYMVVGWWYERRMPDNLQFTLHTRCLVSRTPDNLLYKHGSHCKLDEQPRSPVDGQQRRQTQAQVMVT